MFRIKKFDLTYYALNDKFGFIKVHYHPKCKTISESFLHSIQHEIPLDILNCKNLCKIMVIMKTHVSALSAKTMADHVVLFQSVNLK